LSLWRIISLTSLRKRSQAGDRPSIALPAPNRE
jgi:hypothetical protein